MRRKAGAGEPVGRITADGGYLGDDHVAVLEDWLLAHRIEREKLLGRVV